MGELLIITIVAIIFNIFLVKYFNKNEIQFSKSFFIGLYIFSYLIGIMLSITGPGNILDIVFRKASINISLIPFKWQMENIFGLITNTILFIPLGMLLPSLWKKFEKFSNTVLVGAGLSLMIEICQLFNVRATDIDDLIMNTLGTIIGYLIYSLLLKRITSKIKLKNDNNRLLIKYNCEILISIIFLLNFFIVPFINRILFGCF